MNASKKITDHTAAFDEFPHEILIAEFNYARETAAQAMEDRHKMVNFFLIIVGILASAIGILLKGEWHIEFLDSSTSQRIGISILLFFVFIIGVLYLLKLIRLRTAWFDSALCMNHIKDYYNDNFPKWELKAKAFRWTRETLIRQDISKLRTLFGYSAILVILVDTAAFCTFLFVSIEPAKAGFPGALSIVVLFLQIVFYKSALSEKRLPK